MPYTPPTAPYRHQAAELLRTLDCPSWAHAWEPGTGKTWMALQTAGHWFVEHGLRALLVAAPSGVHEKWEGDVATLLHPDVPREVIVYRAGRASVKRALQAWCATRPGNTLGVLCINFEALASAGGQEAVLKWLAWGGSVQYHGMVVDEFHHLRNPTAVRSKFIRKTTTLTAMRRMLSGTAHPKGYENLWAPYQWLDPSIIACSTYTAYKAEFVNERLYQAGPNSNRRYTRIIGYRNLPRLQKRLDTATSHVTLDECGADIPPAIGGIVDAPEPIIYTVDMEPEQARVYEQLRKYSLAQLDLEGADDAVVSSDVAAVRMLRAQQITGGGVMDDEKRFHTFPSAKTKLVADLVEGNLQKLIIWCRFRHEVKAVVEALEARGIGAYNHSGETPKDVRVAMREEWARPTGLPALVATQSTGGIGFDLLASALSIFYSNTFEYDVRFQAERRNRRIGQKLPVVYWDVVCRGTIDEYLLKVLRSRQSLDVLLKTLPSRTVLREAFAA